MYPYRLIPIVALFFSVAILLPFCSFSQVNLSSLSSKKSWKKYIKQDGILIEYSFQEDNPTRAYKSEYIVLKVTNSASRPKTISWDFSARFNTEKCLNCNSSNEELHFKNTIKAKSFIEGNVNNFQKDALVIFHKFVDDNYNGKSLKDWQSFELKKLTIR